MLRHSRFYPRIANARLMLDNCTLNLYLSLFQRTFPTIDCTYAPSAEKGFMPFHKNGPTALKTGRTLF